MAVLYGIATFETVQCAHDTFLYVFLVVHIYFGGGGGVIAKVAVILKLI